MNVDAAVKLKMEYTLKAPGLAPSALLQPLSDAAALGWHMFAQRDQFVSPEEQLGLLWRPAAIT